MMGNRTTTRWAHTRSRPGCSLRRMASCSCASHVLKRRRSRSTKRCFTNHRFRPFTRHVLRRLRMSFVEAKGVADRLSAGGRTNECWGHRLGKSSTARRDCDAPGCGPAICAPLSPRLCRGSLAEIRQSSSSSSLCAVPHPRSGRCAGGALVSRGISTGQVICDLFRSPHSCAWMAAPQRLRQIEVDGWGARVSKPRWHERARGSNSARSGSLER